MIYKQRLRIRTCLLAIATIISLGLGGCHSSKGKYTGDIITSDASSANTDELFQGLASSYGSWTSLYVPVTLSIQQPKNVSISGRATMVYGQQINISLRFLGMEVGYVYIDTDAIFVVDKFHKYYFTDDLKLILGETDINIADIQDLLLGRCVAPGRGVVKSDDSSNFTFLSSDDQWLLTPRRQFRGATWHYTATKTEPPLLSTVSVRLDGGLALQCAFSEPTMTPSGIASGVSTLTIPTKKDDMVISVIWNLADAQWDTDRKINFSAPSKDYKRIEMDQLIKTMESF